MNSTFLTYKSIMLSSHTERPIPTLFPLSLCFHTQDWLFLSLILSPCWFTSAILSSSLYELHHPGSSSLPVSLISFYCKYIPFLILKETIPYSSSFICFSPTHFSILSSHSMKMWSATFLEFLISVLFHILDLISNPYSPSVRAMILQLTNH